MKGERFMKKTGKVFTAVILVILLSSPVCATNGDNLIGVGPNSRAMGGVGIAYPLDAISAVFANPAAMCFAPYCPSSEFNFSGTLFMPDVSAKITTADGIVEADGASKVYAIPAIGLSVPFGSQPSQWRFGLSAYGVSGLGVDYRGTSIDNSDFYGPGAPLASGEYTQLQIMKFAPTVAYQVSSSLSVGLALHIDYANLDLRSGSSFGYGVGIQPGIIYKPTGNLSLGFTYTSPQSVDHDDVTDFDQDGTLDTLELESPQQFGLGAAYQFLDGMILVEADAKWINWSDAEGYKDFDWDDQWVFAIGAQVEPMPNLFLRIGYNYGKNPVNEHNGWDGGFNFGTSPPTPNSANNVQGKNIGSYYYETFRIIGFPAIVEHHLTLGIGYQFTPNFRADIGYMHAFEETITERGTDLQNRPVTLESSLSEDSLDFGLTWRF
jgi:long-chain fatty acid transport protein